MPKYLKQNGDEFEGVVIPKAWIVIPVEMPQVEETYLIQKRVQEYILLLEEKIGNDLPKLEAK